MTVPPCQGTFFGDSLPNAIRFRSRWYLAPFSHLLNDHNLWGIRRRTVVPAFSIGLFVAYMPFPGHPLFAALLALLFRVNIPVAALTTFVSNPLHDWNRCFTSLTDWAVFSSEWSRSRFGLN